MLNKIIEFSIKNKLIIALFTFALILLGVYETTKLPIDAQPDITNNQVQIITVAPSFGAVDIERLVTFPIEQANSNISGIEEIRSFSRFGLSLVTIVFNDETDIYWARQQVAERLQKIQSEIPQSIGTPELGPISTGLGEIYQYVVRAEKGYEDQYDETELRTIQDWVVRRQLLGVKGVADVSSFGGKLKQYEIAVNPHKLQSFNLTINDVFSALENNNQNTGGAYIEKAETVLFIRSEGLIGNVEDIENISVTHGTSDIPVFLKDVAEINIGHAIRYGAMTYNDEGEVSGAIVMMLKGANSNEVIKNVKERIEVIQKTLPEGVIIEPFLDRTKMVNNTIDTIKTNLLEGALIVVFILVVFLGNFRAGFLVASVIPLSMLFAIIMMNIFGVGGNLMSLGALDFGLIVDGAVIIVEAVMHQLYHHKKFGLQNSISQKEMDGQVASSATKMVNSAVFGQIIILIVYLPIFTLEGIEGKMFKPMAQTVAFALIGAFILSLTYIPMMSALVLSKKKKQKPNLSDKAMTVVENKHQRALIKVLRYPKLVIGLVIALFAGAVITLSNLGGEFIPSLEEGDFAVETRILSGSNLTTTIAYMDQAAHILKTQFPEVEKVVTKIGSGEIPTEPMPMDAGDMIIVLKPKKQWTSAKTFPELAEKMSTALKVIPGMTTGFQFPVQMRFNELMTGARQDVVVKIFGENLDTLAHQAQKLGEIIHTVKGAEDLYIEPVTGMPQVVIEYNREMIARYRLTINDVNRIVNMAFAGQSTGRVFEEEKRFDLVVRLDQTQRKNLEDIRNLLIPVSDGTQIPLYQLATVDFKNGPNQIQREDAKRRIVVGFNVRNRDVQSLVEELRQKADVQMKLPAGYYTTYGGAFENLNQAKDRLMIAVPVSMALIFLLLFFAFRSVKHSLLIYTAIPLSAIGGVYLLALRGMPFSISAGIGFIALFGVAVLNGIVLISEFNRLKQNGINNTTRIVLLGTRIRLRPVLMTAFVASLGFLPMAISTGSGAEVQRPLATVVIGGLLLATFLTLFVLPVLYIIFEKIQKPMIKFKKTKITTVLFLFMFAAMPVYSQTITLEQAIDTALKNNYEVKDKNLIALYHQKQQQTYLELPVTNITGEFGQVNYDGTDQKIGVSQSFSFPTVYSSRKKVLYEYWNASKLSQQLTEREVKKVVTENFYHLLALREREILLTKNHRLYTAFAEKALLRFEKGASNLMEKASAELQLEKVLQQLQQLRKEIEVSEIHLQLLLNTEERYKPAAQNPVMDAEWIQIAPSTADHPTTQWFQQQIQIAEAELKWEKSKKMPGLSFGYYNQTFRELSNSRFHSFEVGIAIPLFNKSINAHINAAKTKIALAENQKSFQEAQLNTQYQKAIVEYGVQLDIYKRYEKIQLPRATVIAETSLKQFEKGEINYLEWVLLNNQAIEIQSGFIDALEELNQSIITLQYLTLIEQ